jgi:Lrp/AsnC family transcriptional regulator for asnA, asnC and gidA
MSKKHNLDDLDRKILSILLLDAELSYKEIGQRLFVSAGTVHVRIKKMRALNIIKGTRMVVDYDLLGYDVSAFLGIFLDKSSNSDEVAMHLKNIPEVVGTHYTTGQYNLFAKVICRDTSHLREVLHDKIQNIPGLQRTETFISLQEDINRPLQIIES